MYCLTCPQFRWCVWSPDSTHPEWLNNSAFPGFESHLSSSFFLEEKWSDHFSSCSGQTTNWYSALLHMYMVA